MARGGKPSGGRDGGDPDKELWRRVTAEVKPLRSRRKASSPAAPGEQPEQPHASAPRPPRTIAPTTRPRVGPAVRNTANADPDLTHGVAAGLDKRTLAKLRRGQLPIEAEIDLHGSTQDQAHRALEGFLARSQAMGRRCVLVITGKGLRADGGGGVLRNAVPRWLNEPPNRERILAFTHATPPDGGEGALYVLLRRSRRRSDGLKE